MFTVRLVKQLAIKSDVLIENFKPGGEPRKLFVTTVGLILTALSSSREVESRPSRYSSAQPFSHIHESQWIWTDWTMVLSPRIRICLRSRIWLSVY